MTAVEFGADGGTGASDERVPVDVAVGVLIDPDGCFLLTSRPAGKVYAGYWEFPGGKLEAGESVESALRRERSEERRVGKECCALCRSRWSPYH